MMKIWNYSPINGELIGEGLADESPLEPGIFLIPAHATTIQPPDPQEDKILVFKNNSWSHETRELSLVTPPLPKELTTEEKLAKAGISIDELKKLLGLN